MDNNNRELLEQINERLIRIETWQRQERRRRIIRICIIAAIIIALAIFIVPKVVAAYQSYKQMVEKVNQITAVLDVDKLKQMADKIGQIDFDTIEKTIDQLKKIDFSFIEETMEKLKAIDFDAITEFINKIQNIGGKIGSIFGNN